MCTYSIAFPRPGLTFAASPVCRQPLQAIRKFFAHSASCAGLYCGYLVCPYRWSTEFIVLLGNCVIEREEGQLVVCKTGFCSLCVCKNDFCDKFAQFCKMAWPNWSFLVKGTDQTVIGAFLNLKIDIRNITELFLYSD